MTAGWQQRPEAGVGSLMNLYAWFSLRIGRSFARLVLPFACGYFWLVRGAERKASREFLTEAMGRPATLFDVLRHFWVFAQVVLDRLYLLSRPHLFDMELEGVENLESALDAGGGTLMLGSHLGSFEATRLHQRLRPEVKLHILMDTAVNAHASAWLKRMDPQLSQQLIDRAGGSTQVALRVVEALQDNGVVAILGDRAVAKEPTVEVTFLGRRAHLPRGPFELALVARAPIILFFGIYLGGNRYRVILERLGAPALPKRGARAAALQSMAQSFADRLSARAREFPFNWFNFFSFWEADD